MRVLLRCGAPERSRDPRTAPDQWRALASGDSSASAFSSELLGAMRAAQAELPSSEPACQCVGLSAAALTRSGRAEDGDTPLVSIVRERYQQIRGRMRGSVYVPRDVEKAFAGRTRWLEPLALDPVNFDRVSRIVDRGIKDGRGDWQDVDTEFVRGVARALGGS